MTTKHDFLRTKTRIGSSSNALNYSIEQSAFNYDDIPKYVKQRKSEILEYKKSKILDFNYKPWNKSSQVNRKLCDSRKMENFVFDRSKNYNYNYRSETLDYLKNPVVLTKTNKFQFTLKNEVDYGKSINQQMRIKEMPIHPSLENKPSWNDTTTNNIITKPMNEVTKLPKLKNTIRLKEYNSPIKNSILYTKKVAELKYQGKFNPKERFDLPQDDVDKKQDFKNREAVEKRRTYKINQHTGIFEYNEIDKKYMWSDTGSYEPESLGDKSTIYDPDAYNYDGPRMATPIKLSRHSNR